VRLRAPRTRTLSKTIKGQADRLRLRAGPATDSSTVKAQNRLLPIPGIVRERPIPALPGGLDAVIEQLPCQNARPESISDVWCSASA